MSSGETPEERVAHTKAILAASRERDLIGAEKRLCEAARAYARGALGVSVELLLTVSKRAKEYARVYDRETPA